MEQGASSRPLRIGISACFLHRDDKRPLFKGKTLVYGEESLCHWVMSRGARAFIIPSVKPGGAVRLADFAADLDGLVLAGGADVAPQSYGEEPLRWEWSGDPVRDRYEIELMRAFMDLGKPVLGVCRGAQLINVALGGTLYQDISKQVHGARVHRNWEIYDQNFHDITLEQGDPPTGLGRLYPGVTRARVNSVHHQGIKDLAKGLLVEARSTSDGIIEAARLLDGPSYVFAVQWHPEFHDPWDPPTTGAAAGSGTLAGGPILDDFLGAVRRTTCSR